MVVPSRFLATGTVIVNRSPPGGAEMSQPFQASEYPWFIRNAPPASAAVVGLLPPLERLNGPNSFVPRLFTSMNTLWLPFARSIGFKRKKSIEYPTVPEAVRGARPISTITPLRGSAGSTSPKAMPRIFSYAPTLPFTPKVVPPNVGLSTLVITIRVTRASAASAAIVRPSANLETTFVMGFPLRRKAERRVRAPARAAYACRWATSILAGQSTRRRIIDCGSRCALLSPPLACAAHDATTRSRGRGLPPRSGQEQGFEGSVRHLRHQPGQDRSPPLPGREAERGEELRRAGRREEGGDRSANQQEVEEAALRRNGVPPRDPRLHDPGRRPARERHRRARVLVSRRAQGGRALLRRTLSARLRELGTEYQRIAVLHYRGAHQAPEPAPLPEQPLRTVWLCALRRGRVRMRSGRKARPPRERQDDPAEGRHLDQEAGLQVAGRARGSLPVALPRRAHGYIRRVFLGQHRDEILRKWESVVLAASEPGRQPGSLLRGQLPRLLDELDRWLASRRRARPPC